jgi:sugar lactone lactonase YvrE
MTCSFKKFGHPTAVRIALLVILAASLLAQTSTAAEKILLAEGLNNPESAVVDEDGRIYVTITGKTDADDDGQVVVIEDGKPKVIAQGMNDPRGICRKGKEFFIADKLKVWRIDEAGNAAVFVDTAAFPIKPRFLNDIEIGADGDIFVSDSGTFVANGVVFRITPGKDVSVAVDTKTAPAVKGPNGLLADGKEHLLLADFLAGKLYRAKLSDGSAVELASDVTAGDGIVRDSKGRIYVGDVRNGRVYRLDSTTGKPTVFVDGFKSAADIALDDQGRLLVPDSKAGTLTAVPITD